MTTESTTGLHFIRSLTTCVAGGSNRRRKKLGARGRHATHDTPPSRVSRARPILFCTYFFQAPSISIPVDFGRDPRLCWPEKQAKTCVTCDTSRSNLILHPGWFPACSEGFPGVFRGCCGFYIQTPFGYFKRNHTDPRRLRQRTKILLARERVEYSEKMRNSWFL